MFDAQELTAGVPPPPAMTAPLPTDAAQPVHLLDRLNAVFKHRRLAGTAFTLVVATMMIQTYSTVPTYEANARVQILDERSTQITPLTSNDPAFWADQDQYYKTQYAILQSRALARRVVERLHLLDDPAFTGNGPRPRDPISLLRQGRSSITGWFRTSIVHPGQRPETQTTPDENARESAVISGFLGGVRISPESGTRLVTIQYHHSDPRFAAIASNTLAEEYTSQNLDLRMQNVDKALKYLGEELQRQQAQLIASEKALTDYRERNNALSLEERQNTVAQRVNSLADMLTHAQAARAAKQAAYDQIKNADPKDDTSDQYSVIGNDPNVVAAKNQLGKAQAILNDLTNGPNHYGSEWPAVKSAKADAAAAQRALVAARANVIDTVRNEYNRLVLEERQYAAQNEQAKTASMDLDRKSGDYKILERKADADRIAYNSLLQRQKDLSLVANSHANNVQVYERAEIPRFPIAPNPRREWMMALLAGVTVAFLLAFGIEYLDDTVKVPEDITRRLRLPMLGLVPAIRGDRVPVLTETVPHEFGEAFRSLRTSLVFTAGGDHGRTIVVTSSQPLEGKTTTAANLAMALALGGSRVLLIDADMRRPGLHKTIGVPNGTGLSHLLVGQARVRDAVQRTTESNLLVITAGRTPPNPSELLGSERMQSFLHNLQKGPFDWIVIDTPPVLAVTDAVILAPHVSGVVFVIGSEMTRRVHAERALDTLRSSRPRSITAVLNRVDFDRNKYYYSRYYGYQYKSYYGQSQTQGAA
jgi:polysaccharide biosynthesis transport protein